MSRKNFRGWESNNLDLHLARGAREAAFRSRETITTAIANAGGALAVIVVTYFYGYRLLPLPALAAWGWTVHASHVGYILAGAFAMRALKAMFLFGVKPQMLHLNAKQRRLLGLPPKATAEEPLVLPDQLAPVTPSLSPSRPNPETFGARRVDPALFFGSPRRGGGGGGMAAGGSAYGTPSAYGSPYVDGGGGGSGYGSPYYSPQGATGVGSPYAPYSAYGRAGSPYDNPYDDASRLSMGGSGLYARRGAGVRSRWGSGFGSGYGSGYGSGMAASPLSGSGNRGRSAPPGSSVFGGSPYHGMDEAAVRASSVESPSRRVSYGASVRGGGGGLAEGSDRITDASSLSRYLTNRANIAVSSPTDDLYRTDKQGNASAVPYMATYHPAKKPQSVGRILTDNVGALNSQAAALLLGRLGLSSYMEQWTENLRRWLSRKVLTPVADDIAEYDRLLAQKGLNHLLIRNPVVMTGSSSSSGYTTAQNDLPRNLEEFYNMCYVQAKHRNLSDEDLEYWVGKRKALEAFLAVKGEATKAYVVDRIAQLAEGSVLMHYRWNSGGKWNGKEWSSNQDLPTDAEIVMHLFCTYMDQSLPVDPRWRNQPFSKKHFVATSAKLDDVKSDIKIFQTQSNPPHFKIALPEETWETTPGRNNLFHTVILFTHFVRTEMLGYLAQVDLSGDSIALMSILD